MTADQLARVQVDALHGLGKGGGAQVLLDLVAGGDQRVDPDREVLVLLKAGAAALVDHLELQYLARG